MGSKFRLVYVFIILCSIAMIIGQVLVKTNVKKKYDYMYLWVHEIKDPVENYIQKNFECPESMKDILFFEEGNPEYQDYVNKLFVDPLSRKVNGNLQYVPLYNRINLKREGFILLSAGFDGKIDNLIELHDTLYLCDFTKELSLYNPSCFYKLNDSIFCNNYKVNLLNYFFGQKDFIFLYENFIEDYVFRARVFLNDGELVAKLKNNYYRRNTLVWGFSIDKDFLKYDDQYKDYKILINGYAIHLKMYADQKVNLSEDKYTFVGTLDIFNNSIKEAKFKNCIEIY
jgi:hypothetical protein